MFGSVPNLNVTVNCIVSSADDVDDMYSIFSTPLTCCSIGSATVSARVFGSAPGNCACTTTVGGAMVGNCATGKMKYAIPPSTTVKTEITIAKIGRSMKKRENFMLILSLCGSLLGF